jgi:sugar/nucleoside kinase (ribokinase family)
LLRTGGFLSALVLARHWSNKPHSQAGISKPWKDVSNEELARALRIGSFVAAQKCQQPGARKGLPSIQDHAWLQAEQQALIHVATSTAAAAAT